MKVTGWFGGQSLATSSPALPTHWATVMILLWGCMHATLRSLEVYGDTSAVACLAFIWPYLHQRTVCISSCFQVFFPLSVSPLVSPVSNYGSIWRGESQSNTWITCGVTLCIGKKVTLEKPKGNVRDSLTMALLITYGLAFPNCWVSFVYLLLSRYIIVTQNNNMLSCDMVIFILISELINSTQLIS